ncbi:MAG: CBS domain-containing protein [Pirellulaceae bacterium]|nr:CBS domain-containing protein [Pirellulaceae bacterium]
MLVQDVMTRDAESTRPNATLQEVAARMQELNVGSLPVCDDGRLVGMITDRDITVRSVSQGHDPQSDRVADVMTLGITCCFEDQSVEEAAQLMTKHQIRRLPVLSRDKQLVGIVSLGDLAVQTGDDELVGETVEGVSEPSLPNR